MSQSARSTAATYFRLLRYTKPYWKILVIGILSGVLVGGSLFVTLMLIPRMVGAVEPANAAAPQTVAAVSDGQSHELLAKDPKLRKIVDQATGVIQDFHLPARISGTSVTVTWPR